MGLVSAFCCFIGIGKTDKQKSAASRVHIPTASEVLNSPCLLGYTPITRWELMLGEEDAQELLRGGAECSKEIEALLSVVDIEASSGPAKRGLSFFSSFIRLDWRHFCRESRCTLLGSTDNDTGSHDVGGMCL